MRTSDDPILKKYLEEVKGQCGSHENLYRIFEKGYLKTLNKTLYSDEDDRIFVITGDIPAMWQRDSSAQLRPFIHLAKKDPSIKQIILKVLKRQFFNMNLDPYANAFNQIPDGKHYAQDCTNMTDWVWERKFELDSLCYPVQLAYLLYKKTGETTQFNEQFNQGVLKLLSVFKIEQNHKNSAYFFERDTDLATETLANHGRGNKVKYTGMIWSGFRPSDDACTYNYLIPSNMFAVVILKYLQEIYSNILKNDDIVICAKKLEKEIENGIKNYGIIEKNGRKVYAYEVDGLGNAIIMDDANIPSLLAAPYLGYCSPETPIYLNTRHLLLSNENPYFYFGQYWSGQGSQHSPQGYIWPLAMVILALTQSDKEEQINILDVLSHTTGGTNSIHESFDPNNPRKYTRDWFSWADMMFCELLLKYLDME